MSDAPLPVQAVLLTPVGRGAVASVRVEGPTAAEVVARHFHSASGRTLAEQPRGTILFGRWGDEHGEELVVARLATDVVEIHCHGGHAAAENILQSLREAGCRQLDWREWQRTHAEDPIAAEARLALAECRTQRTAAILLDQLAGALRRELESIVAELGAGKISPARARLETLLARAVLGQHLVRPFRVVLAGTPNVGKSSLINALVGYRRAVVFDEPGTTRDVVTATTALEGWPVELADTAGLRDATESLEAEGMRRSREQIQQADCVVLVSDASCDWSVAEEALRTAWPDVLLVHNKADLAPARNSSRPPGIMTSAVTGLGVEELGRAMAARLVPEFPAAGVAVPFTSRQVDALQEALEQLAQGDLGSAMTCLQRCLA